MSCQHHKISTAATILCCLFFWQSSVYAITLTSGQTRYITTSNINTGGETGNSAIGINSTLSGSTSNLNTITNAHQIITGNSGLTSGAYGIKSGGSYNQITINVDASILTTGNTGRAISVASNSKGRL